MRSGIRNSNKGSGPLLGAVALLATLQVASVAAAPPAADEAAKRREGLLEEIVVTANKRSQRLLDVPMAVSAITAEDIENRGTINFKDLALTVPSLSMIEAGTGRNLVQIRGIANRIGVPTVGYYIDEMAVSTEVDAQMLDVRTLDLERIEVLRGPQGTLYGQGSIGGAIRFITAEPVLDEFLGHAEIEGSTVTDGGSGYRAAVVGNIPVISDKLALRVVAAHQELPGWIDNTLTGKDDVNEGEIDTYRVKALWQLTEDFRATVMVMHQESSYDAESQSDEDRTIAQGLDSTGSDRSTLYNLTLDWNLGPVNLLSSTGYMDRLQVVNQSLQEFAPLLEVDGLVLPSIWDIEMFQQELRLSSQAGSAFNWTVGAFYRDITQKIGGVGYSSPALPRDFLAEIGLAQNGAFYSKSWALFGEVNREFQSGFGLTLGLRYFEDERSFFQDLGVLEEGKETFDTVNPRLIVSYRVSDDFRVYASAAKGFRSGGFNNFVFLAPDLIPPSYDVEDLWTYELGSKASLADGRVSLEGAVFFNDYANVVDLRAYQLAGRTRVYRANAGDASGLGVEFSGSVRVTDGLTLSGQASWNDLQYDETTPAHNEGDTLDSVPKFTASISSDYRVPVRFAGAEEAVFRLDYQYRDTVGWRRRDLGQVDVSDEYRSLDARIGLKWSKWELSLAGQNLSDENGRLFADIGNLVQPLRPQPRTISLLLRADF